MSGERCEKSGWRFGNSFDATCGRPARVTRNGKRYCGIHDPERADRAKRRVAAEISDNADRYQAAYERTALRFHDRLVELAREGARIGCENPQPINGGGTDLLTAALTPTRSFDPERALLDCGECFRCRCKALRAELEKEQGR